MNKHKVTIEIEFRSGHRLIEPYVGKCNNVHGEGYTAIIELESDKLNKDGMVIDFGDIKKDIKEWINTHWDHAYLHHSKDKIGKYLAKKGFKTYDMGPHNPTAEWMSQVLYTVVKQTLAGTESIDSTVDIEKVSIVESFRDSIASYERTDIY